MRERNGVVWQSKNNHNSLEELTQERVDSFFHALSDEEQITISQTKLNTISELVKICKKMQRKHKKNKKARLDVEYVLSSAMHELRDHQGQRAGRSGSAVARSLAKFRARINEAAEAYVAKR